MNYLNGQGAEMFLNLLLREFGFKAKSPITREELLAEVKSKPNRHFRTALHFVEKDYPDIDVNVNILVDRLLGIDGFIEANDGSIVSYDITVNPTNKAFNHKANVQRDTTQARVRLGLSQHILIVLKTNINYIDMSDEQKWFIIDSIMDAVDNEETEVYITV